ncbi:hypothetical protein HDZ31DRAFT_84216 [Schizophyllum fasciatum]
MIENRDAVCKTMGAVPITSVDIFLKSYLPQQRLAPEQLDAVMVRLKQGWRETTLFSEAALAAKKLRAEKWKTPYAPLEVSPDGRTRWTDYAISPARCSGTEKDIFSDLVDINGQIIACCLDVNKTLARSTEMRSNGSRALHGHKVNPSMPDGVHLLVDTLGGLFDWDSTAVVDEYKCMRAFNTKKMLWGMHHMLRSDPRRRFAFGMTFANTDVRLWHYNRSVIVVSESFDLNMNAPVLIDVYSRFAFASMAELGYDPTIKLLHYLSQQVCGEWYITMAPLSNHAAENGVGRCSRVHRAYKENETPRQIYVIKDSWVEAGRKTEYEIYQDIMAAIDRHDWSLHGPPITREEFSGNEGAPIDPLYGLSKDDRKRFIIPIIAGERVKVNGIVDNTRLVIGRGHTFPPDRKMHSVWDETVLTAEQGSVLTGVVGDQQNVGRYPQQNEGCFLGDIPPREHHRIVMKEGQRLTDILEAKVAFSTAKDASYALFVMHSAGFLYRDISAGNILRYEGRGVLADIEYVKAVDDMETHNMRTGTADFVAVEVVEGKFLGFDYNHDDGPRRFVDSDDDDEDDEDDEDDDQGDKPDDSAAAKRPPPAEKTQPLSWRFRDAHDLESIFWLVLWLLFRHVPAVDVPGHDGAAQLKRYNEIFPHFLFSADPSRISILRLDSELAIALRLLPKRWKKIMGESLRDVRDFLIAAYHLRRGKPLHPGTWLLLYRLCSTGQLIKGQFKLLSNEKVSPVVYQRSERVAAQSQHASATQESVVSTGSKRGHQGDTEDIFLDSGSRVDTADPMVTSRTKRTKVDADDSAGAAQVSSSHSSEA